MHEIINETLPERWLDRWETMRGGAIMESSGPRLQEWLEEVYFDGEKKKDMTMEDIVKLG